MSKNHWQAPYISPFFIYTVCRVFFIASSAAQMLLYQSPNWSSPVNIFADPFIPECPYYPQSVQPVVIKQRRLRFPIMLTDRPHKNQESFTIIYSILTLERCKLFTIAIPESLVIKTSSCRFLHFSANLLIVLRLLKTA
jgi:hypothetical protein